MTPVSPSALITGDVVTSILSTLVTAAVLILIGTLFFRVSVTGSVLGAAALTLLVSAAAFCGMGYAISSFVAAGSQPSQARLVLDIGGTCPLARSIDPSG